MSNNQRRNVSARLYYILASVTALVLMGAYLAYNWGYAVDDSYITFRYAQNARLGYGFVFNVGERFYGSTATGYAILLAMIAKIGDLVGARWTIPNISTVMSGAGIACLAGAFALAARVPLSRVRPWLALPALVVGMSFLAIFKISNLVSGHETYFYVGLVSVAAYVALFHQRNVLAVCILFVATTCRPDVALLALMLFMVLALRGPLRFVCLYQRIKKLIPPGLLYLAGLAGWLIWTKFYYGSFLPETLQAKEAQVKLGVFETFNVRSLVSNLNDQFGGRFWIFLLALALTVAACVAFKWLESAKSGSIVNEEDGALSAFVILTLCYSVALALAYTVMHVTVWMWYVTPIGLFLALSSLCASAALLAPTAQDDAPNA